MKVRTRYAPSPTGFFHLGGARTALFNYAFAKHMDGEFIVRIEDTDIARNVDDGVCSQLANLKWLGIDVDESPENPGLFGPYSQMGKLEIYQKYAMDLLANKKAYYCFCTPEELAKERESALNNHQTPKYNRHCYYLSDIEKQEKLNSNIAKVLRLKISDNEEFKWNDIIRGEIKIPTSALTDPVILKSNGIAMYNFAVVIDDYQMEISHVLRGEEHISNTPYQIAIHQALGFKSKIKFGHLSIITNMEGRKLSKRDLTVKQFINDFRELGYLPSATTNFLALLGWTPKDNIEIFSMEKLIKNFDLKNLSKAPAKFDAEKLLWISNQYFKKMETNQYLSFIKPFIKIDNEILKNNLDAVLLLLKDQVHYASQINDLINNNFNFDNHITDEVISYINEYENEVNLIAPLILKSLKSGLENETKIECLINEIKINTGLTKKNLFMPLRILLTKQNHGPAMVKLISLLSSKQIISNINSVLNILN